MALDLNVARIALSIVQVMREHTGSIYDGGDHYCRHGVNVGNWAGPDLMCGACEDGIGDYAYALMCAYDRVERERRYVVRQRQEAFSEGILRGFKNGVIDNTWGLMMYRSFTQEF